VGQAILHIHTTFSDGTASVAAILDEVEANSDIDVVGFTDHDDVQAYFEAIRWKALHPGSRVQPLWGVELTIRAFKHLLVYCFEPPVPEKPPTKFLSLSEAVRQVKAIGGTVVVPHVDTFWIGMGRHRLAKVAAELGIHGLELLNPYLASNRSVGNLVAWNQTHALLGIGGSDAHHVEDLYKVIVDFPGRSVAELGEAFRLHTATARWGWNNGRQHLGSSQGSGEQPTRICPLECRFHRLGAPPRHTRDRGQLVHLSLANTLQRAESP
jgi:predicted metal-dependent phosphoesterase TrpH